MPAPSAKLTGRQRRLRRGLRKTVWFAVAAPVIISLVVADRAGLFGARPLDDRAKYEGVACRVVRVVDGDTLDVDIPDGPNAHTRIRLWGVDTPEAHRPYTPVQHFAPEASDFTERLTMGREVTLRLEPARRTRDNPEYNRLLAYVILPDERMLNRLLVAQGYGYADPRYQHTFMDDFLDLQDQAHAAGRGLWANPNPDHLPDYLPPKLTRPAATGAVTTP